MSRKELEALFANDFDILHEETILVPVNLQSWMDLTNTKTDVQKDIIKRMKADLEDGVQTGFYPYVQEEQIFFDHRWLLMIGIKK